MQGETACLLDTEAALNEALAAGDHIQQLDLKKTILEACKDRHYRTLLMRHPEILSQVASDRELIGFAQSKNITFAMQ